MRTELSGLELDYIDLQIKPTNIRKHNINIVAGQINKYWRCNIVLSLQDKSKKAVYYRNEIRREEITSRKIIFYGFHVIG
jgi:spore germination protein GerM